VIQWRSLVGGTSAGDQLANVERRPGLTGVGLAMSAADEDAGVVVDVDSADGDGPGMAAEE